MSKLIQPGIIHPGSREHRRMSLIEANKRLIELNRQQARNIQIVNVFLTKIATMIGTGIPGSAAEATNAADAMLARIEKLVETEKTVQLP